MISLEKLGGEFYLLKDDDVDKTTLSKIDSIIDQYRHVFICDWVVCDSNGTFFLRMEDKLDVDGLLIDMYKGYKAEIYQAIDENKELELTLLFRGKPIPPNKHIAGDMPYE